jgi:hypothetical protein
MNALGLLLTVAVSTLVLQSGEKIAVQGEIQKSHGVVVFRSNGVLYSLPASEIARVDEGAPAPPAPPVRRLRVSEEERRRLIAELEKNHAGTAPPRVASLEEPLPPLPAEDPGDEASWRAQAREHEENVRRAREDLALLETRIEELRNRIHSFISLGYKPRHFTYDTSELARAEEQIPYARLEVTRAERAWDQFREDARRAGVLPGWLR